VVGSTKKPKCLITGKGNKNNGKKTAEMGQRKKGSSAKRKKMWGKKKISRKQGSVAIAIKIGQFAKKTL